MQLFYTALFNAIQSVLIRLVTTRRTNRNWVQTEDIDIGHYVAVRKEFDRVESEWKHLHLLHGTELAYSHSGSYLGNSLHDAEQEMRDASACGSVKRYLHDFSMKLRYPRLYFRKRKLVVPVRFHELRHHFIQQNGLSSKFKVSQYLKRSLTSVLLDFVHISSAAWIMIMALSILLYFICGIALSATGDKVTVYEFLISAMSSGAVLFLIISFVLYLKMKTIISKILVMKLFVEDEEGREKTFRGFTALQRKMKSYDQISLFWGSNPRIIIYLTQCEYHVFITRVDIIPPKFPQQCNLSLTKLCNLGTPSHWLPFLLTGKNLGRYVHVLLLIMLPYKRFFYLTH